MTRFDVAPTEGFHPEIGLLLATLEDGSREWREELGEPTPGALRWQPFPNGHSIGTLILHIAHAEAWWIEEALAGRKLTSEEKRDLLHDETHQDDVMWPTPPEWTCAEFFDRLDRVRKRTAETLRSVTGPDRTVVLSDEYSTSVRWIVAHLVQHESYHGGQAVLLRLMHERMRA